MGVFESKEVVNQKQLRRLRKKNCNSAYSTKFARIGAFAVASSGKGLRPTLFYCRSLFMPKTFKLAAQSFSYVRRWKYRTWNTERQVEIALGLSFLRNAKSTSILEVGNVMHNYTAVNHVIVDKYEVSPGVLNEDIVTFAPGKTFDSILSISTMEHVGRDELPRDDGKGVFALNRLRELLAPDGRLLLTVPTQWNPSLDDELVRLANNQKVQLRGMRRASRFSVWKECSIEEAIDAGKRYRVPFGASGILVVQSSESKA